MGDFKRDRSPGTRSGSRFGRGDTEDSGRGFGRSSGRSFGGRSQGRGFGRDSIGGFKRGTGSRFDGGKSRADYEFHKVICAKCGKECEVPFKPTSNKPVYCSDCFKNPDAPRVQQESKSGIKASDLDLINEKLNKIMKALKIE